MTKDLKNASLLWDKEMQTVLRLYFSEASASHKTVAERIYTYLASEMKPSAELDIMTAVRGKRTSKVLVLRKLVGCGLIRRVGEGRREAPYRYSIDAKIASELEQKQTIGKPSMPVEKALLTDQIKSTTAVEAETIPKLVSPTFRPFTDQEFLELSELYRILNAKKLNTVIPK
jgi:hypothetical protein